MTTYAFFRSISALCKTLDDATRFTGVSIQILVVYTGYLIREYTVLCDSIISLMRLSSRSNEAVVRLVAVLELGTIRI